MNTLKIILTSIIVVLSSQVYAQNSEVKKISLAEALTMGVEKRYDAQANELNIDLANNTVTKNKKEWLPDISASGIVRYNTQLQTMIFPSGLVSGGDSKVVIGTKNQTTLALDLTQNIYKPGLTSDIKIARVDALLEEEKNKEKNISIKQSIAEAYLNVVLKRIQWKNTVSIAERNSQYRSLADEKFKRKVAVENDLLKATVDYQNATLTSMEAKVNYELAMLQLKFQLNIDSTSNLVLTDSIEVFQKEHEVSNREATNTVRTELKQLTLQYQSNLLRLQKSKSYFLPTVSIVANYSTQFQSENFNYQQNSWSPFNYVSLKLSLPLTGNFKNSNSIREYQIKMQQNQLQLKQKQQEVDNEIVKYRIEMTNAERSINVSRNNLELSRKVYQTQLNMYQLGTVTYGTVLDTESSLSTSEQNYLKSVYNYLVAKISYEKSTGRL